MEKGKRDAKIKKTYIQQKQECFQSILGKYMPLNGIRSKSELSKKDGYERISCCSLGFKHYFCEVC